MIDDTAALSKIRRNDNKTGDQHIIGETQTNKNMKYEIRNFVRIIETNDRAGYETLKQISREVLAITEAARKQNGIIYSCEKEA